MKKESMEDLIKQNTKEIVNIKEHCAKRGIDNALMAQDIKNIKEDVKEIKDTLKGFIDCVEKDYAKKEEFIFWRNILISGILGSIFLMLVGMYLK